MDFAVILGTGSTKIYKRGMGIVLNEAVKIAYTLAGKKSDKIKVIAVGNAAARMVDKTGSHTNVESPIFNDRIVDVELAKLYFSSIFKKVSGPILRRCLFCIPCSLTATELGEYKSVAYSAGLTAVDFVPSVITNLIAFDVNPDSNSAVMSVIIGEGGTDIAVIADGSIINGGSMNDGGASMTQAVKNYIEENFLVTISDREAEIAKTETASLLLNDEISYRINGLGTDTEMIKEVTFTGKDCYKILFPIYNRIAKAILQTLSECAPDVINEVKNNAIYIGGSASTIIGLREFLANNLDMNIVIERGQMNSVVIGAGKLLDNPKLLKKIIKAN